MTNHEWAAERWRGLGASRYAGQGAVVGTGGALGGVVTGAGPVPGVVSGLTAGSVVTPGAEPGLTSLGITGSGEIAVQDAAELTIQAAGAAARWATGIGAAKAVFDLGTFLYGAFAACPQ